ncbi:penicillin-binding protein activator LpoB [Marinobacter zhanjiangensis]|uniref:Penicillin-binding protein activator LpoB n=1 Tax=Marinobacter zhanjiangensis TaxID=578215 RepID=A0ABQ3B593_9GAMM|nr:penicillin-binding protein activator LpoB [Marinobacter zhanjiangensis]GGY78843.1 penicillin-binding protein activator LpoB [Marinobacter zhanjiangensis]
MFKNTFLIILAAVLVSGCATETRYVDPAADDGPVSMSLDYRDFDRAATEAVEDMLASGVVDNPNGGRYIMVVSRITNDTMQRIDTDRLVKKIRVALLRSGKVVTTTAVGLNGAEDEMSMRARELRDSEEFDQSGVQRKGTLQAPDLSLSGKLMQKNHQLGGEQRVEYSIQLTLTDLATGLAFWEGETPIIKQGSGKSVSW